MYRSRVLPKQTAWILAAESGRGGPSNVHAMTSTMKDVQGNRYRTDCHFGGCSTLRCSGERRGRRGPHFASLVLVSSHVPPWSYTGARGALARNSRMLTSAICRLPKCMALVATTRSPWRSSQDQLPRNCGSTTNFMFASTSGAIDYRFGRRVNAGPPQAKGALRRSLVRSSCFATRLPRYRRRGVA